MIYAANVPDTDLATGNIYSNKVFDFANKDGSKAVLVSAQVLYLSKKRLDTINF